MGRMNAHETTSRPSPAELRVIAVDVAREAAELIATMRESLGIGGGEGHGAAVSTKSSAVDPVTEVDTAAEQLIVKRLREVRPEDGVRGEEGARTDSATGVQWIIDPIDGTVNFLYGIPAFAVSLGAAVDGEVVAGAVHNVVTGEVFSAAIGEGATCTVGGCAHALRASNASEVSHVLLATGFSYSAQWRSRQAAILGAVLPAVRDIRRAGSAALDLCAVAAGRVDAYYEHGTHPWDWAAGSLIAREAGAMVEHPEISAHGSTGDVVYAAAPGVAETLKETLRAAGALEPLAHTGDSGA